SIELGVWVDKLIPRGANWLLELEDVRGFGRVALSNILVVGRSRKDAVIQPALKGEGIFLFQVYACGIRRRCGADRQRDRQEKAESSRHERTCALADWAAALRTRSRHVRRASSTTSQHRRGHDRQLLGRWHQAPASLRPQELRIAREARPVSPKISTWMCHGSADARGSVASGGIADMNGRTASAHSVEIDPGLSFVGFIRVAYRS